MGLGLRGIVLINIMAKFRKMYAKKRRSYNKKRGFKKRRGNKMMSSRNSWTNQVWTQSYALSQNAPVAANPIVPFVVDCLGNSVGGIPDVQYFSPAIVQNAA